MQTVEVQIRALKPGDDMSAFRTLNEEWINRHFVLEEKDRETLGDPEKTILSKGGEIFMMDAGGESVGCVALVPMGDNVFELSKMAVTPRMRGMGLGRRLVEHLIAAAKARGAAKLFLGSSTRLPDALHLYEAAGFQHVAPEDVPPLPYTRADVFMELRFR